MKIYVAPIVTNNVDAQHDIDCVLKNVDKLGVFEQGGFIAGGFARRIAHAVLKPGDYMATEDFPASRTNDIDIFFPRPTAGKADPLDTESDFFKNINSIHSLKRSFANFAWDAKLYQKVQLVDHEDMRYNSITECFNHFDFTNCMYAIDKSLNGWTLHFNPDALDWDAKKMLHINTIDSPFLATRIVKYIGAFRR